MQPLLRDSKTAAPVYFEAAATIVTLVLLGQVLELGARQRTGRRSGRCSTFRPGGRSGSADGGDEEVPLGEVRRRRSVSGARRREGPGRRSGDRRRERRRRVDDHRGADPRGQGAGRSAGGRHAERIGRAGDARRAGRARDPAGADRPAGRRSAAEPRAHSADGRRRLGSIRAGRRRAAAVAFSPGRWSARRPGSRTRSSPRSRC